MTDWNDSNALYVAAGLTAANRHGFWDMDTGYYPPPRAIPERLPTMFRSRTYGIRRG